MKQQTTHATSVTNNIENGEHEHSSSGTSNVDSPSGETNEHVAASTPVDNVELEQRLANLNLQPSTSGCVPNDHKDGITSKTLNVDFLAQKINVKAELSSPGKNNAKQVAVLDPQPSTSGCVPNDNKDDEDSSSVISDDDSLRQGPIENSERHSPGWQIEDRARIYELEWENSKLKENLSDTSAELVEQKKRADVLKHCLQQTIEVLRDKNASLTSPPSINKGKSNRFALYWVADNPTRYHIIRCQFRNLSRAINDLEKKYPNPGPREIRTWEKVAYAVGIGNQIKSRLTKMGWEIDLNLVTVPENSRINLTEQQLEDKLMDEIDHILNEENAANVLADNIEAMLEE